MKFNDISALVTGGGSGLGKATAQMLADTGADVAVLDIDEDSAQNVANEIGGIALTADVSCDDAMVAALDQLREMQGDARIVVNCAGIGPAARIVGRDGPLALANFQKCININLGGTFNVMRLTAHRMSLLEPFNGGARGVIVNTASVAAFEGQIGQTAYAASKGGIVAMTLPAAREFAQFGIRVNVVAPGIFLTPLLQGLPEDAQTSLAKGIPFPSRLGQPSEFAQTVKFCVENDYLNGEVIRLDGATRLAPR